MEIRKIQDDDFDQVWEIIHKEVASEETYCFESNMSKDDAYKIWITNSQTTYVAIDNDLIIGTYFLKANFAGPGNHVCNCGYMVSEDSRGQGIATQLCIHSQQEALNLGYEAMIFRSVVSTNKPAVYLWRKLGFDVVGVIPRAFRHKQLGYVDIYVMYKWLDE